MKHTNYGENGEERKLTRKLTHILIFFQFPFSTYEKRFSFLRPKIKKYKLTVHVMYKLMSVGRNVWNIKFKTSKQKFKLIKNRENN